MELKAGINGLFFWANPAGQVFFGKDILSHKISDVIDTEYLSINFGYQIDMEEILSDILQGRKDFFQFRTKTRRYDGQFLLLHWQLRPIRFEGIITGISFLVQNFSQESTFPGAGNDHGLDQNGGNRETDDRVKWLQTQLQESREALTKASENLNASNERLELALFCADESLWDWEIQTGNLHVHNQLPAMLGYDFSGTMPFSFWEELLHPDDRQRVLEDVAANVEGRTPYYETEYRLRTKKGDWIWIQAKGKVVAWDKEGRAVRSLGVHRDITEKKRHQKEQDAIFNAISEVVMYLDLDGKILWANKAAAQSRNLHINEIVGKDCCWVWQNHRKRKNTCPALKCIQTGKSVSSETADDQGRTWLNKTYPLQDENGHNYAVVLISRDVTEQKNYQERIKASEKSYRHLFEKSPIGLMKCDKMGNITEINRSFLDVLQCPTKKQVLKINLLAHPQEQFFNIRDHLKIVLETGQSMEEEMEFSSFLNKKTWVYYKIDPVKNEKGQVTEAIIACQDITDRKKSELEIRFLTFHDCLTGLYNRTFYEEEKSRLDVPRNLPISVISGDLNGLKLVNDAFGHQKGDELLMKAAQVLKKSSRGDDMIARVGGDEFVLVLPHTSYEESQKICQRIRKASKEMTYDPIEVSISLGTATKETQNEGIDKVISQAEEMMYRTKLLESKHIHQEIISALEKKLLKYTHENQPHIDRLVGLSIDLGKRVGLDAQELDRLRLAARYHDIGKAAIPLSILNKKEGLTKEEWHLMKQHSEIGYRIAVNSKIFSALAEEILTHHEKWDGTGYPTNLKGQKIPLISRIIAIADAYCAMVEGRPYREPFSPAQAREEIRKYAGMQFDPELVKIFRDLF